MGDFGISEAVESALIGAVISAGLSLLSSAIFKPKSPQSPISYPPNEITRGGYLPVVIGRRVVGCNIGWVGSRVSHAGSHSGGSEIEPGPSTGNVYYEGAWHQLCHGPGRRIYRIWNGSKIASALMLDATTDSDGVLNQLPVLNGARDADYYRTFFGRDPAVDPSFQPVDAFLQAQAGLTSNYPGLFYVMWQRKALGGSPTWSLMKYEIEVRPEDILEACGLEDIFTPQGLPLWYDESTPAESIGGHQVVVWLNGKQPIPAGNYTINYINGAFKVAPQYGWQTYPVTLANFSVDVVDSTNTSVTKVPDHLFDSTVLTADVVQGASTILVASALGITVGRSVKVDEEVLNVLSVSGTTIGTSRLFYNHSSGAPVQVEATTSGNNQYDTQLEAETANAGATKTFTWAGGIMGFRFEDIYYHPTCVNGLPNPTYAVQLTSGGSAPVYKASIAVQGGAAGSGDSGCNPAAALWILLCAPFPYGCGLSTSYIDQNALLVAATQLAAERLVVNVLVDQGRNAPEAIASLLSDIGMVLPQVGAQLVPYLIRTETTVPEIPDSLRVGAKPEQQRGVAGLVGDRYTFQFNDVLNEYAVSDITIDNDAQAFFNNRPQATTIKLENITNRFTAQLVAYRRAPELAVQPQSVAPFKTLRETRNPAFHPGRSFVMDGVQYRVTSWKPDTVGVEAEIGAALDQYGDTSISYDMTGDGYNSSTPPAPGPEPDLYFAPFVIPRTLWASSDSPVFGVPRVRANDAVTGATIWISNASGGTYNAIGFQNPESAGGLLLLGFNISNSSFVINSYNDDILDVPDLTGDTTDYANGSLTALVDEEIFLIESVSANEDGSYTINNVSGGAFNTTPANHSAGTPLVIISRADLAGLYSPLLNSVSPGGGTLWIKTQPTDGVNLVQLSIVIPQPLVVPPNLLATITIGPIPGPVYVGDTVTITWVTKNLTGNLNLTLSIDGGVTFTSIASGVSDTGSYAWLTSGVTSTTDAVVRVSSATSPLVYDQTYPFAIVGNTVTPDVFSPTQSFFGAGKYYPPATYTVGYISGSMSYNTSLGVFSVNRGADGYVIYYNNGAAQTAAPGTSDTYANNALVQAANAGQTVSFNHSGGTISVGLVDEPYTDNAIGPPAVTFGLV